MLAKLFRRKKPAIAVDVLTGYALWAEAYPAKAHNPLMELEQEAMLALLPANLSNCRCLDVACGSGRYLRLLHNRQAAAVIGLDVSPHMLRQLDNGGARAESLSLLTATFTAMPFPPATFQWLICGLAVGHERNLKGVLAEAARLLCPGGSIIYSDFHPFGALLGWQRTFSSAAGQLFQLEHHLHLYSHHVEACRLAGLTITAVSEPRLGQHAPAPQFQGIPAVLVIRASKAPNAGV